jgi:hypothetical protein
MDQEIKLKRRGEHTPGDLNPYKGEKAPNHNKGEHTPRALNPYKGEKALHHTKRGNTPGEHTPQTPYKGDQTPRMVIANHQTRERAPNHTTVTGESTTRRVNIGNNLPY